MTTSPTPATPSPEQKLREAISTAIAEGIFAGEITATSTVSGYSPGFVTRILSALQSSGCLKVDGADTIAVPRALLGRLEQDSIKALFDRERAFGKDAEVCLNNLKDIEAVQRLLSPEWAAHRHGPAPTSHQLAPSDEAAKLVEIREVIDGYIDGAPDRGRLADVANRIALIIDGPL